MENERTGPGRKPEPDKKVQVAFYLKKSFVDRLGGMAAARGMAEDYLAALAENYAKADRNTPESKKARRHV